jgi:hypothetical protein
MDVFNAGLGTDSILIWWKHLVDYLDWVLRYCRLNP